MARLAGNAGSVMVGTTTVAGIKQWHLVHTMRTEDTTGFDSGGWERFTPTIKGWNGDFDGFKDGAPLAIGSEVVLTLKESATTGQLATGTAIISDFDETVPVDGIVVYRYTFVGVGTLTTATA